MDSSPRDTLLKLFEEIIEWQRRQRDYFNWNQFHLSLVRGYVSKLGLHSDLRVPSSAELFMDIKDPKIVASFAQELQEFFIVPRLHQLFDRDDTHKKNELVAAFINFLLQLLSHKTDFVAAFEDRIDNLEKELRFLLTVLGDTILLCDEHEQVQNLLAEFEAVANEAGSLLHSFFFSMDPVFQTMDEGLVLLSKHIKLLKYIISEFLILQPFLSKANITPKTVAVDSLFIVDSLLHDLEDLLNQDDSLIVDVKGQIIILHQELILSLSFLKYIKVPRHSAMEELKESEIRIRGVAYEAEYLISSFLVGDAPLWYLSIRLPDVIHKIKLTGIQEIKNNYDIGALKVTQDFSAQISLQAKRNSEVDDITVGFEENSTDILDQLVGGGEQLEIISIFGMPGLGKTTFAKKLYNHPLVNFKFDKRSWCVVSQTYQRRSLLTDILMSLASELDNDKILNMEEESLVEHIYKSLKRRRYLIVMDDIWDSNAWNDLQRCFPDDGNESRILFTSRNIEVAPPNSKIFPLPYLSNDQCWELLEKKVFHNKPCPQHFLGIGKEIAANCYGLPLAVVVISGILSTMNKEESTWKEVGENVASYISYGGNNYMMQILELSYKHLPEHLRPCFLYFGAFPEDTQIPAGKLMRLWIAEGFVRKEERKSSERVAEEYLMELIDKSLVIVAKRRSDGGVKACVVHDLLRDLCLRRAEEVNFLRLVVDDNYSIYEKGHRLLSIQERLSLAPFGQHVRSFRGYLPESPFYVLNMTLLRVLDFKNMISASHLIGIEFLVRLRYLVITDLPASIGSLVNLEFLDVQTPNVVVVIPSVIVKMTKLRYFHVSNQARYEEDCDSSQTNNLQSLSCIEVYSVKDEEMLKCSPHLRRLKCICGPFWVEEKGAYQYRYPDLLFLTQLDSLHMITFCDPKMAEINFPSNIKKLTLSRLGLPWQKMSIIGGLPNLEVLKLVHDAFRGETWDTRDGEFQQLRFLKLYKLDLAQWNVASGEHFPRLQRLVLFDCYNLRDIPCEIGEIGTLQLIEVQGWCLKSLLESATQIEQEQRDMGNEELRLVFS